jgi:hypothetical protein
MRREKQDGDVLIALALLDQAASSMPLIFGI